VIPARRAARRTPPKRKRESFNTWKDGYISQQSLSRTSRTGLRGALNTVLSQDGTIRPRPARILYGSQPVGIVLGEIAEFVKRTGSLIETYEISVQNVAGTARVYVRKDGGNWTVCLGKNFNTTAKCHFCPIRDVDASFNDQDKVLILNGQDNFSYLDINTLTVVPFVALAAASAPALTAGSGLTGTTFPNRYRVTAGNRITGTTGAGGETAASATTTVTTSKIRESWSGASEYVDVTITRVPGANRYHIYSGLTIGQEAYLYSIDDPGTGTTVTWRDTGTVAPDTYRTAPLGDTTAGPIGTRAEFINGQVFIVGDKANPKYVRFGGTGASVLDFSPYGGGGYQPVGGNKEFPIRAKSFRRNDGSPGITILCSGTNGQGKRYIFTPQSITIGSSTVSFFAVSEENGSDGTNAPDSIILSRDELFYLSGDGPKTTLTKPQVQTILSTQKVGDAIQEDYIRLNKLALANAVGLAYEDRLYWALPVGSDRNNQIWTLDLSDARKGAWMLPWEVEADWMWLYNDNAGNTHFCTLANNKIYEFSRSTLTQDAGVAFSTSMSTGRIKFSEDGQEWAKVRTAKFVIQHPVGVINVSATGRTEDSETPVSIGTTETFRSSNDVVGWDENPWDYPVGWDGVVNVPQRYGVEETEIVIEIDEELKWLRLDLSTMAAGSDWELTDLIVEHIPIGTKD
jgi:hypothetical protein